MSKYFNVITIVTGLMILFIVSETIYTFNNLSRLSYYLVHLATYKSNNGDVNKALDVLEFGAKHYTKRHSKYAKLNNFYFKDDIKLPLESNVNRDIQSYLKALPFSAIYANGSYDLARIFYEFGLLSYKNGEKDLTEQFFKKTKSIDPTLSYWQVELSNFYYLNNDKEKALETLEDCRNFEDSKYHCEEFKKYIEENGAPHTPGFLLEETNKQYDYPSIIKQ